MSETEWEDKLDEVQKHSEHWYEMYSELKTENAELKKELTKRAEQIEALNKDKEYFSDALDKQIEATYKVVEENNELKAQIEKMKCCFNCKHSRTEYEHCRTDKHEKWEIKEK